MVSDLGAMKQSQRIAKNVLAGGISTVLGGAFQLAAVLLIARRVSVAEFGIYSFTLAFAFLMSRLGDMGVSNILVARHGGSARPDRRASW